MTSPAVRRIVEAFFRRWPFYVLLLIAPLAIGVYNISQNVDVYSSSGSIFVDNESLVSAQAGVRGGDSFGFQAPAGFTSQELSGLIRTDEFIASATGRAGVELSESDAIRGSEIQSLRSSLSVFPQSDNLVSVSATTPDPELSSQLVSAVIEEFVQFQIDVDIAESTTTEVFFAELVDEYQEELVEARNELNRALRSIENIEALPPSEQLEIERLQNAEALAVDRYRSAVESVESAQLASRKTETDIRLIYSIFDPPQTPSTPDGSTFDDIASMLIYAFAGLVLAAAGPVAAAVFNRTLQFPDDLDLGTDLSVLAVLPRVRRAALRLDKTVVTVGPDQDISVPEILGSQTITFLTDPDDLDALGALSGSSNGTGRNGKQPPAPDRPRPAPPVRANRLGRGASAPAESGPVAPSTTIQAGTATTGDAPSTVATPADTASSEATVGDWPSVDDVATGDAEIDTGDDATGDVEAETDDTTVDGAGTDGGGDGSGPPGADDETVAQKVEAQGDGAVDDVETEPTMQLDGLAVVTRDINRPVSPPGPGPVDDLPEGLEKLLATTEIGDELPARPTPPSPNNPALPAENQDETSEE